MSSYGIINTIQAPTLEGASQPELIKFEVDFAAYNERIEDINSARPPSQRIKAASIRQCMKPRLLHSLCILGRIGNAGSSDEATDEAVKIWFDARLASTISNLSDRVEEALATVKYKHMHRDPSGAAENLVLETIAALDEYNASSIITDRDQCKELIAKLVKKLEPAELRQIVTDQMRLWKKEQKGDIKFFTNTISTLAAQVHTVQCAMAKLKRKNTHMREQGRHAGRNEGPDRKRLRRTPGKPHSNDIERTKGDKKKSTEMYAAGEWKKPCLNVEKCSGIHPISKCPVTTKEERRELLDKHFGKKKTLKVRAVSLGPASESEPNAEEGRYRIFLNDIEAAALGDSGADYSTIPSDCFETIIAKYPELVVEQLPIPLSVETALCAKDLGQSVFARRRVSLNLTIILPQTGLPVCIRGVQFLIADSKMPEILLGRPLLKAMGFDFNAHLQRMAPLIDGKSEQELRERTYTLASTSYHGARYTDGDEDPIELPECLHAGFGPDTVEEIEAAIRSAVGEARKNGMSDTGAKRLEVLLKKNRSSFGIQLGSQPPADVRPLSIKLAPNAKPYRTPQRFPSRDEGKI